MQAALTFLEGLPEPVIYLALGLGAALENVVPVIPADTFVVAGGFVAGLGAASPILAFLVIWAMNVGGAVLVYWVGLRYGISFFTEGRGSHLLSGDQLGRLHRFYDRWGVVAIFLARFLPGFRALVPIFAGVSSQRPLRVVPPLAIASAIWYGGLVRAGVAAGANADEILATLRTLNTGFLVVSLLLSGAVVTLWWRTRSASRRRAARQ